MDQHNATVIAVVTDDARADPVIGRAIDLGQMERVRVILYDIDAAPSILESPLPTEWSSDGLDRDLPPVLTAERLETLGQPILAKRVRALGDAGIEAYGWLPDSGAADELARYADAQGAGVVIALDDVAPTADELRKAGVIGVETVPLAS